MLLLASGFGIAQTARAQTPVPTPTLSIADATTIEGNSGYRELLFPVTLSKAQTFDVSASFKTKDITATANSDYVPQLAGQIVVKAGQTRANVLIRVLGDTVEEHNETFLVQLGAPKRCGISDSDAIGTITDDDYAGRISVSDTSFTELNSGQKVAKVQVSFSSAPLHDITLSYGTKDDSAKASFDDYVPTSGSLLFRPGRLVFTVAVPIIGDTIPENNEKCLVRIDAPGYTIAKSLGVISILNDDGPITAPSGKILFTSSSPNSNYSDRVAVINAGGTNQTQISPQSVFNRGTTFSESQPHLSPDGSKIAFLSDRGESGTNVFVMNADGSGVRQISDGFFNDSPGWSPDSTKIVFQAGSQLCISNPEGTVQSFIDTNLYNEYLPSFAPNGRQILFTDSVSIYLINLDGSGLIKIGSGEFPSFSPDGRKIVFVRFSEPVYGPRIGDIYLMNADGTGVVRIAAGVKGGSQGTSGNNRPVFSPDGFKIAFESDRSGPRQLFTMERDGSRQSLVKTSQSALEPFWATGSVASPDAPKPPPTTSGDSSGQIVYRAFQSPDLLLMKGDGSGQVSLTNDAAQDRNPALSRDGQQVVWISNRDGSDAVWTMNLDGSNAQKRFQPTDNASLAFPRFSPDGEVIAFERSNANSESSSASILSISAAGTAFGGNPATLLSDHALLNSQISFSPDGSRLVFTSSPSNNYRVHILSLDLGSGGETALTGEAVSASSPSFSRDGTRIVFVSQSGNRNAIFVMGPNGEAPTALAPFGFQTPSTPCFSPLGKSIAFYTTVGHSSEICVMNADGTDQQPLSHGGGSEPFWGVSGVSAAGKTPASAKASAAAPSKPSGGSS